MQFWRASDAMNADAGQRLEEAFIVNMSEFLRGDGPNLFLECYAGGILALVMASLSDPATSFVLAMRALATIGGPSVWCPTRNPPVNQGAC